MKHPSNASHSGSTPKVDPEQALTLIRKCSEAKTIDDALRIITDEACVLVDGRGGSIWVVSSDDPTKIVLRWTYRTEGPNKVGESFYTNTKDAEGYYDGLTGWVFAKAKPLCLRDITDKAEISLHEHLKWIDKYGGYSKANDPTNHKHFMAVPIFSCRSAKKVIAVLRIGDTNKSCKPFDQANLQLLQTYAGYISGLLTSYIKREEEKTLIGRLFTMAGKFDLDSLLDETVRAIPIVMDGSYCSIFIRDPTTGDFCLLSTSALDLQVYTRRLAKEQCLKYKPGSGKTGAVALDGKTCRVSGNITSSAGVSPELCECGTTSSAFLCAAIRDKNQAPVGVVRVTRELAVNEAFDVADEQFLESFAEKLYHCLSMHGFFTKGACFVVMPFGKRLDDIYTNIIKPSVEKFNLVCRREDEYPSSGLLTAGIVSHIADATLVVADLTGNNPNVYYELGIAHTLKKFVILLSQDTAPSNIQNWKYIHYDNKAGQASVLSRNLSTAINEALHPGAVKY